MNAMRVFKHFSKYIYALMGAAATMGVATSCIDDMIWRNDPAAGDGIRFGVTVDGSWQKSRSLTRSGNEATDSLMDKLAAGPSHTISAMEGTVGGKTVYMHTIVDSWDAGIAKNVQDENSTKPKTRGTVVAGEEYPMYPEFGMSAYYYSEPWSAPPTIQEAYSGINSNHGYFLPPNHLRQQKVVGSNGHYALTPPAFWPEKGLARVLAYAPYSDPNIAYYNGIDWGRPFGPALEVTVPDKVEDQRDILIGMSDELNVADVTGEVDLNFKHAMTGIRFAIGDDMVKCVIEEITLTNIYSKAYLFYSYSWANNGIPTWASHQATKDFTIRPNLEISGPREDLYENRYVDGGNLSEMLIMLPQTPQPDSRVIFKIRQRRADGTLAEQPEYISRKLDMYWGAGQIITYRLSYDGWWNGVYWKDRSNSVNSVIAVSKDGTYTDFVGSGPYDPENPDFLWFFEAPPIELPYISYNVTNQNVGMRNVDCTLEFDEIDEHGVHKGWSRLPPDWLFIDPSNCKTIATRNDPNSYYTGEGCEDYSKKFVFGIAQRIEDDQLTWSMDDVIYQTPPKGSQETPYNLASANGGYGGGYSDPSGSQYQNTGINTTANCYMIAGPGWYMFPCVYGNAITRGLDNVDAYDPARNNAGVRTAGPGVLKTFVNHLGNGITHPIIKKNTGCSNLVGCKLVWTDTETMITNMEYLPNAYNGVGGIRFYVPVGEDMSTEPHFKMGKNQGNSVLALKDSNGATVWSWHIWVTPVATNPKSLTDIQNKAGETYKMMAINLGWISTGEFTVYRPRSVLVKMTNINVYTGKKCDPAIVELHQREYVRTWHGYSPYWQWGRKDPFQPGLYEFTSVPWWQPADQDWTGKNGNMYWGEYPRDSRTVKRYMGTGMTALKNRIQNPNTWHFDNFIFNPTTDRVQYNEQTGQNDTIFAVEKSHDNTYYNLWNAKRTTTWARPAGGIITAPPQLKIVKTVYDPCPPGYKVPPMDMFTGITQTGDNSMEIDEDVSYFNGVHDPYPAFMPWLGAGFENNQYGRRGFLWKSSNALNIYLFFADRANKHTVGFPMSGYRWMNGATLTQIGTDGYYWTAECSDRNNAYYMTYSYGRGENRVNPMDAFYHLDGMSIRPVVDDDSWEGVQESVQTSYVCFYDDPLWKKRAGVGYPDQTIFYNGLVAYDMGLGIEIIDNSEEAQRRVRESAMNPARRKQQAGRSREVNARSIQRRVGKYLPAVARPESNRRR